jgi:hypothetical protein
MKMNPFSFEIFTVAPRRVYLRARLSGSNRGWVAGSHDYNLDLIASSGFYSWISS